MILFVTYHFKVDGRREVLRRVRVVCDTCQERGTDAMFVTLGDGRWEAETLKARAPEAGLTHYMDGSVSRWRCGTCAAPAGTQLSLGLGTGVAS